MKQFILCIIFLVASSLGFSQNLPEPVVPKRIVNDLTGLFTPQEQAALENKLRTFNDTSSTQIAIATVATLDGLDPNDYAQRLAQKWGVGQKGKNNGILLVIKPKKGQEKGQVAIAVGYGLEGAVPDAIASRIIRNEIIPEFQNDRYYTGVDKATNVLMQLTGGEYTAEQYAQKTEDDSSALFLLFLIPFFLIPLFTKHRKGFTTHHNGTSGAPFIFFGGMGNRNNNDFGSFSGGSGSFGGFGGGSFGGGGASGSW